MHKLIRSSSKEQGFTLIELLTVIVIIGILAAIAIPVFTSQRARAQDSATISDVRNIAVQAETFLSYPTNSVTDLSTTTVPFTTSPNVAWTIVGNSATNGFCITAFNKAGKKYSSTSTLLTYDSTAGGIGQSGKSCDPSNLPIPSSTSSGLNVVTGSPSTVVPGYTLPASTTSIASATYLSYVSSNSYDNDRTTFWHPGSGSGTITYTFPTAQGISSVGIDAVNDRVVTVNYVVYGQKTTNGSWSQVGSGSVTTVAPNNTIGYKFASLAVTPDNYTGLRIVTTAAATGYNVAIGEVTLNPGT